jgi:hypothetical protein
MQVTAANKCSEAHGYHTVEVPEAEYAKWKAGEYIQDALVSVTAEGREILLSGMCQEAWDEAFPEEDDF